MKYIRTEDGIYENKPLEKHLGKRRGNGYEIVFKEQDIINQADTIEELCDEFVSVIKGRNYMNRVFGLEKAKDYWLYMVKYNGNKTTLYGAIYTDKGLIYVAKMNDKGELELL